MTKMENGGYAPLYSGNRVESLRGLFKKPDVSGFKVVPNVVESSKEMAPDELSRQTSSFYKNRELFDNDLDWHMARDPYPLPILEDRELYGGDRHVQWWCYSLVNFMQIYKLYSRLSSNAAKDELTYFEIGCASGRVLRHALLQRPVPMKVVGCDTNARHVEWMRRFLPENGLIFQNTTLPSLPLPDKSVDIAVGLSVFTHIDDLEFGWLMELRRIMKPGALAFLTVISDLMWERIGNDPEYAWILENNILNKHPMPCKLPATDFKKPMPEERMVFWSPDVPIYNTDVYHHSDYLRREWGRFFTVVGIYPAYLDSQDLVVLQKT